MDRARRRRDPRRRGGARGRWFLLAAALFLAVAVVSGLHFLGGQGTPEPPPGGGANSTGTQSFSLEGVPRRVLVYDSLYREYPNDQLLVDLVSLFESHGYRVDVYKGVNATLDPLVALGEYGIVILRAHGAYNGDPGSGKPLGSYVYTGLYVVEAQALYSPQYIEEGMEEGYFSPAVIPRPGVPLDELPEYLAVSPKFFRDQLGGLPGSIVFFTGCYGMDDDRLGSVFVGEGAYIYLGWVGNVTWIHSDDYLLSYMRALLDTGDPLEALAVADQEVGPDPYTGARVEYVIAGGAG